MIYRIVPAALVVALCAAAISVARAGAAGACTVQGGTTVFLYDHAPLALTDRVLVVKGAKGCPVRAHALVAGCAVWAASVGA